MTKSLLSLYMKKKLGTPPLLIDFLNAEDNYAEDRTDALWDAMNEIYEARMRWIKAPFGTATDEPDWDKLGEVAEMEDFAERGLRLN